MAEKNKAALPKAGNESGAGADPNPSTPPTPPTQPAETAKKVRVIVESGTLGPLLLKKGDVTSDPDYVAVLKVPGQKKVEAVK